MSLMNTYARFPVTFVSGRGAVLTDENGKDYIDFASGIGVNAIGYGHPRWTEAVSGQAAALAHVSNLYHTLPGAQLAQKLCALSGMSAVFFANSGAEANEGVIKCARKYSLDKYGKGRHTIVTLSRSFHGRTVTTLAATGQESFHQHFFPFTEGFVHVEPGDLAALQALGDDVCAVFLECVQGEGGVWPLAKTYLQAVQALCRERDWLLCLDEVQTGAGRCGTWFAYQTYGLSPDLVSFAKGWAGGLPLGGFLAGEGVKNVLGPGTHATTFGANPVCCAAALSVVDILTPVLPQVTAKGDYIRQKILAMNLPAVSGVRGLGLMLGVAIQSAAAPREWVAKLLAAGLVTLTAGSDAIRLLPPLTITDEELDRGLTIFERVLREAVS